MWKALQDGWIPQENITQEEYYNVKKNLDANPTLSGFVGFTCSFGGRWFQGYARDNNGKRNYALNGKNTLLKDIRVLRNATFVCLDYRDVDIPDGAVVYCDPPYMGTTKYSTGPFNHEIFWSYMRELSGRRTVFISEEHAPNDFECIWEKEVIRTVTRNKNNQPKRVERLFKWNGESKNENG